MLKLGKNKAFRLLALSFMFNITVAQPVCSTIAYAATRDSDYHTLDNNTSKRIQNSRDYLYTPYKSDAERQAEAEALRQQQEAAAAAQRRAAEEAAAKQSAALTDRETSYNADGTVKELSDGDQAQQARERLQQMMKDNPPRSSNNFMHGEEKKADSLGTRVTNQLDEKDKEVLFNTYKSADYTDENYRLMAQEVCKQSGLSDRECVQKQAEIQNCLWGELSHVEASGAEYEKARETAMNTCVYFLQSEKPGEETGFIDGLKKIYEGLDKTYKENAPEALKFILGDSIAEVGVTAGLTLLSFASFGIAAPAAASLKAVRMGTKVAGKADKLAGMMGKTTNLSEKFVSTLSPNTKAALNVAKEYKNVDKETMKVLEKMAYEGRNPEAVAKNSKAFRETVIKTYGEGPKAEMLIKANEEAEREAIKKAAKEASIKFQVLERSKGNAAKLIAGDVVASKVVNTAGAGDYVDSSIHGSDYNVENLKKAMQNEEFAKLLESKRSDADITKIAKSVSSNSKNESMSLKVHEQVERNVPKGIDATPSENEAAIKMDNKAGFTGKTKGSLSSYVDKHNKKISDGLKDLGVTNEEVKEYSKQ